MRWLAMGTQIKVRNMTQVNNCNSILYTINNINNKGLGLWIHFKSLYLNCPINFTKWHNNDYTQMDVQKHMQIYFKMYNFNTSENTFQLTLNFSIIVQTVCLFINSYIFVIWCQKYTSEIWDLNMLTQSIYPLFLPIWYYTSRFLLTMPLPCP